MSVRVLGRSVSRLDPAVVDALLVLGFAAVGLVQAWPGYLPAPERWGRVDWIAYGTPFVIALAAAVPLWFRRTYPVGTIATVMAVFLLSQAAERELATPSLALFAALFALGRHSRSRRRSIVTVLLALGGAFAIAVIGTGFDAWLVFMGALMLGVWLAGDSVRTHEARVELLQERAARHEAERRAEAARAAEDERGRIARELHDVIAHNVSVMVVQAAAAGRIVERDPAAAKESLATIESTGRQALAEMRRLLGILRRTDEAPQSDPQPSLARLPQLVEEMRASGLPVDLSIVGSAEPLPPGVDLSAYRVVQEALTNALRHAGATPTRVRVRYGGGAVELEVTDEGGAGGHLPTTPGGHGLAGMRERVDLVHGELEMGPRPGGGYRVWARLPVDGGGA